MPNIVDYENISGGEEYHNDGSNTPQSAGFKVAKATDATRLVHQPDSRCTEHWSFHGQRQILLNLQRPVFDCHLQQLSDVRHPSLSHHISPMRLHSFYADLESLTDFIVLKPSPDKL